MDDLLHFCRHKELWRDIIPHTCCSYNGQFLFVLFAYASSRRIRKPESKMDLLVQVQQSPRFGKQCGCAPITRHFQRVVVEPGAYIYLLPQPAPVGQPYASFATRVLANITSSKTKVSRRCRYTPGKLVES